MRCLAVKMKYLLGFVTDVGATMDRVEGNVGCTEYQLSLLEFSDDIDVQNVYNSTLNFYHSIWESLLSQEFPLSMANFHHAYDLYDYANYKYIHDNDTRAAMANFAGIQQRYLNANLSASGSTKGDMIRAISGRTLAGKVLSLLSQSINTAGGSNKLNLLFGSFEPLLAFFELAGLTESAAKATFLSFPNPGATMIWEVFSVGGAEAKFPSSKNDLWVRFLYRNGTDAAAPFVEYPLFGNGNSESRITWAEFSREMNKISVSDLLSWCNMCGAVSLFCYGLKASLDPDTGSSSSDSGSGSSGNNQGVSPVVAGVIGAAMTVAIFGLVVLTAFVFGGVRLYRCGQEKERKSSLGGFKGAEKMASDMDVTHVSASGIRHERTGSWELRNSVKDVEEGVIETTPPTAKVAEAHAPEQAGAFVSRGLDTKTIDDDAISEINYSPVMPREF
jgi:hypothetical protein